MQQHVARVGFLVALVAVLPACGGESFSSGAGTSAATGSFTSDSVTSPSASIQREPVTVEPLPQDLVGTWQASSQQNQSGSHNITETYSFWPDGRYDYTLGECLSWTDCKVWALESGYVRASGGILSFEPQTESSAGHRAGPYRIGGDGIGGIQLELSLIPGSVGIYYRQ